MLRTFASLALLTTLGSSAFARADLRSRLRPITAPVKDAGTLHLGTGTWTRAGAGSELAGTPGVVYSNTCSSGYYTGLEVGEIVTDTGGIPDTTQALVPSTSIPGGFDRAPGCASEYNVTRFRIGYCTYVPGASYDVDVSFYDQVGPATAACTLPGAPTATFHLTGLPGSTSLNAQACWVLSFDLIAAPPSNFALTGSHTGGRIFAWSFTQVSPVLQPPDQDGPILSGGVGSPSPAGCTGTDGTRWDSGTASVAWPNNRGEEGTGMFNLDAFRLDGNTTISGGPGCYWFGGVIRASLEMELYSDVDCPSGPQGVAYCFGDGSTATACPCGNSGAPGAGCNNSIGNGGAVLSAAGTPSLANDTISFTQTNELGASLSIFLQGTIDVPAGVVFGDGIRCAGGSLKRLYVRSAAGGTVSAPIVGSDVSVSALSAILGDTITAGSTRYYGVYYRDASAVFCPNPPGNTWNIGNGYKLTWGN